MKSHHVQVIPKGAAQRIRELLMADGFEQGSVPHADFELIGTDVRVIYYPKRSKLLVQGAGTDGVLRRLSDVLAADPAADAGGDAEDRLLVIREPTIGSDESGKGDYFGPLVVAGCLVGPDDVAKLRELGVRDSKEVSETKILAAEVQIERLVPVAVCALDPPVYGRQHEKSRNVNRILGMAHAQVIRALRARGECRRAIVDRFGGEHYVEESLGDAREGLEILQVPRAEQNVAVAAASFIARARFVRGLQRLSDECGVDLLPGASEEVEERARKVFAVGGIELLGKVAKLHFKTTERVVGRRS